MKPAPASRIRQEQKVKDATNATEASALMRRHDVEYMVIDGATVLFTITDFANPFNAREFDEGSDKERDLLKLERWMLTSGTTRFDRRDDLTLD